jgi:hypothetical protein
MRPVKGDLTIAWDKDKDPEMVEHIQALMDKGVTFHRIDTVEKGKIRKRVAGQSTQRNRPDWFENGSSKS